MSVTKRFIPSPGQDNTLRTVTQDAQAPAYAASLTIVTTADRTIITPAPLTGAQTLNLSVGSSTTAPFVGDEVEILYAATGGPFTVTLGTGAAVTATTLVVGANKYASIKFRFNGTIWQETDRAVTI
jgi:hypothetical protein